MREFLRVVLAVSAVVMASLPGSASAAGGSCSESVGLWGASSTCMWSYAEYQQSSGAGDGHTWVVAIQCGNGGICTEIEVEITTGGR